jgi:hypothetical protein
MIEILSSHKLPIAIFLILLGIAGLALLLDVIITGSNANKYNAIGTILAALVGIAALVFIGYQASQLKASVDLQGKQIQAQGEEFRLERRPYLYLHLPLDEVRVWRNVKERAWFGGGNLRFRNVGKDPATITETSYMVASDVAGSVDFVGWFEEAYGGFPDIKTVFPGQEDAKVPCHPVISSGNKKPKLLYIGAVVSYVGPISDRIYWYKFSQLFVVKFDKIKDKRGKEIEGISIHPHRPDHDWDKNTDSDPPSLKEPNWKDFLSKSYIKTLTE